MFAADFSQRALTHHVVYLGMRRISLVLLLLAGPLLTTCEKEEEFKICGTGCPAGTPWTVESLDQGLPCFANQSECRTWANANGYSDKDCIQCN